MPRPAPAEELREQAREHVEQLPAETALSHQGPQGGGEGQPADYDSKPRQDGPRPPSGCSRRCSCLGVEVALGPDDSVDDLLAASLQARSGGLACPALPYPS